MTKESQTFHASLFFFLFTCRFSLSTAHTRQHAPNTGYRHHPFEATMKATLAILATLATAAIAAPATQADAPYPYAASVYQNALYCPKGTANTKGILFAVHGTGSTGSESWANTPYAQYLPSEGFAICWVTLGDRSLNDTQDTASYVSYWIKPLAAKSATKKVALIGHSQGAGLNIPWSLEFWPSNRPYVSVFIALAGDFRGTDEGILACTAQDISRGGCVVSVIQQSRGSNVLQTQYKYSSSQLVNTYSLFTRYDDVIQSEQGAAATSLLNGAQNHAMQDLTTCGPAYLADHFSMLVTPAAYAWSRVALGLDKAFDPTYCTMAKGQVFTTDFGATPAFVQGIVNDVVALTTGNPIAKTEPCIRQYAAAYAPAGTVCKS
ncbi:uncharacterized protein L969DRAFT_49932 [Mixia osmundae IAM 14324]|uniref:AB hydrolase-1 domain-containing protein n=1 Tax=Mixia osmundae (strain CBS 9802 / IAM 14324 / JCM 22182 / KY 12970) TaxID=764103 RepID=G7E8J9_MIXOS|nr:uncharacterized protein L969DRAFT_49932 [Mixia osmundae IAM 14324]KEI38900.1 hypothetical protein L969DRAFT_49932 [Mixia osmundae IAM 14324]GAA99159.1 hypothetical protein E5Q_05851 [Mixia osmundae IAM 14324]